MNSDPNLPPPVDRARLERATGGDSSFERELIALFFHEVSQRVARLRQAILEGEFSRARLEAHTIKGAAANLGAERLRQRAQHVEHLLSSEPPPETSGAVQDLESEIQSLSRYFERSQGTREGAQ